MLPPIYLIGNRYWHGRGEVHEAVISCQALVTWLQSIHHGSKFFCLQVCIFINTKGVAPHTLLMQVVVYLNLLQVLAEDAAAVRLLSFTLVRLPCTRPLQYITSLS